MTGQVDGIADGDTLTLLTPDKKQHRIRVEGIDAPERTQPLSQRSKQSLTEMAHRQQAVAECTKETNTGATCARCWWTAATLA